MTDLVEQLRTTHRHSRAALSQEIQASNAEKLWRLVSTLDAFQQASRVAAYISIRGEIDVSGLMESGALDGKQFYLPVLDAESMHFAPWSPGQALEKNGFGLLEPSVPVADCIDVLELDVVLAPLVVFDSKCNRIGQGGGFYDRTFAHKQQTPEAMPILVGVAHESQREAELAPQSWDIPLDIIATDSSIYYRQAAV